jgi:quinoprotein glucose dehydrogenase
MCKFGAIFLTLAATMCAADWRYYGYDPGNSRYSPEKQINTSNVKRLKAAWTWHTGDKSDRPVTQIQCTPLVIDGVMYVTTAQLKVAALRAGTGDVLWTFDPFANSDDEKPRGVNRGVMFWSAGAQKRVFFTYRHKLVGLDAVTGKLVSGFGDNGVVDLTKGLDRDITDLGFLIFKSICL